MWSTVFGFALLVVLAVAVLPLPRVRKWLLTALARLGQAIVLAFLGACGTFLVEPEAAPAWLTNAARPLLEGTLGLPLDSASGLPWIVLAVLVVAVCLPVLMAFELGAGLSSQTVQVQALRREIRHAAAWVDNRLRLLGVSGPAYTSLTNEADAAIEALRSAGRADGPRSGAPEPLVIDLLK